MTKAFQSIIIGHFKVVTKVKAITERKKLPKNLKV